MFVAEIMPEEAKDKLPFKVFTNSSGERPTLWKWVVDKERNSYMVFTKSDGGPYEGTQLIKHFALYWDGHLIGISADPMPRKINEFGATMYWKIRGFEFPVELQNRETELKIVVQEAFRAMGELFDGEEYFAVVVDYDIRPIATYLN